MSLTKIIKDSLWYGVVPKLSSIISIIVLPIVTPYLTPKDYGIYGIISAYLSLFNGISTLGLHMHLPNSFFTLKQKYKLLWRRIFGTMLISCIILSIILFCLYLFILPEIPIHQRWYVAILAIIPLLFSANGLIANNFYVLIGKPQPLVLRNLLGSIISIITFFICARFFQIGYLSWIIASAFSTIVIFILFIKPIWINEKIYPQLEKSSKRQIRLLKIALPVIPHNLGHILLSSADRIIMTILGLSLIDIGLYSNGHQIGDYTSFAIIGIFTAISPAIQKAYRTNNKNLMLYYYLTTQILCSVIVFLLAIWMKEIYYILIKNEELQKSYLVASVICFSLAMYSNYAFMSTAAFIKEKTGYILYLVFIPGIINILLAFCFIPIWGYIGAAFAMLIANWSNSLIPFFIEFYKKEMRNMLGNVHPLLYVILLNILLFIFSIFMKEASIFIKAIITLGTIYLCFISYHKFVVPLQINKSSQNNI